MKDAGSGGYLLIIRDLPIALSITCECGYLTGSQTTSAGSFYLILVVETSRA